MKHGRSVLGAIRTVERSSGGARTWPTAMSGFPSSWSTTAGGASARPRPAMRGGGSVPTAQTRASATKSRLVRNRAQRASSEYFGGSSKARSGFSKQFHATRTSNSVTKSRSKKKMSFGRKAGIGAGIYAGVAGVVSLADRNVGNNGRSANFSQYY